MPGLFDLIDREAEIRNLGLVDIHMAGSGSTGGLASTNLGPRGQLLQHGDGLRLLCGWWTPGEERGYCG